MPDRLDLGGLFRKCLGNKSDGSYAYTLDFQGVLVDKRRLSDAVLEM